MMLEKHRLFVVWLLLLPNTFSSVIQIESDGGYANIAITVSDQVEYSEATIQIIQAFFTRASEQLYIATFNHTFFKTITIVVPNSWPVSASSSTSSRVGIADIQIDNTNELFQNQNIPYTQQPRSCGEKGNFIYLTIEYINRWNDTKDSVLIKRFIQAWAKLRYGIFEETGNKMSAVFPDTYMDVDGMHKKTGCALHDPLFPSDCETTTKLSNCSNDFNETLTQTISYFQSSIMDDSVENASVFCMDSGNNLHNSQAPTRQNALCRRKSTWQIISETSDFSILSEKELTIINNVKPTVTYFKKIQMSIVFVIDPLLCSPDAQDSFLWYTLRRFINLLQANASIGFAKASVPIETMAITQTFNAEFDYNLNYFIEHTSSKTRSIEFGITKAIEMLEQIPNHTKHLILITDGSVPKLNISMVEKHLVNNELTFFLLTWTLEGHKLNFSYDSMKIFLDYQLNALWFNIPFPLNLHECNANSKYAMEDAIVEYFNRFSKDYFQPKAIKMKTIRGGKGEFKIPIKDAVINFKTFYCDKSRKEQMITINNKRHFDLIIDNDIFTTSYLWRNESAQNDQVEFTWQMRDAFRENHQTSIWSVDNLIPFAGQVENSQSIFLPNVLYAYYSGNLSILARVVSPDGVYQFIELRDNGNGDPDVKAGDGIFSRYLIYPNMKTGLHFISIIANDSVGDMILQTDLGSFILLSIEIKSIPPNRIGDFHIKKMNILDISNDIVSFQWTAPGGDFDHNSAKAYFLSCSPNVSHILVRTTGEKLPIKPQESGRVEIGQWRITSRGTLYHCGLRSTDNDNNTSEISNIVTIYIPELPTTSTVEETTSMLTTELGELPSTVTNHIESLNLTESENQNTTVQYSTYLNGEIDVSSTSKKDTNQTEVAIVSTTQCLSTIEITGIAAGSILIIIIIVVSLFVLHKCKQKKNTTTKQFIPQLSSSMPNNRADVIRAPSNRSSIADIESISNDINTMSTFNPQTSYRSKSNRDAQMEAINQNHKFERDLADELPAYKPPAISESEVDESAVQYTTLVFNQKSNAPKSNRDAQMEAINQNPKFERDLADELPAYKPPAILESDVDEDTVQYTSLVFNQKSNAPSESNFKRKPQMGKAPHVDELYAKIDKRRKQHAQPQAARKKVISITQV